MAKNFNEKDIENAIQEKIIALSGDFSENNVLIHAGATNPNEYRSSVIPDKLVLIAYQSVRPELFYRTENQTVRPERIQIAVVYYEKSLNEYQNIYTNKNLIKNALFSFNSITGDTDPYILRVKLNIINESRLPYSSEFPDIDGFVWILESVDLYKVD